VYQVGPNKGITLPCSQQPVTSPYPEPDESSTRYSYLRSILIWCIYFWVFQDSLSFRFPNQNPEHSSLPLRPTYMPHSRNLIALTLFTTMKVVELLVVHRIMTTSWDWSIRIAESIGNQSTRLIDKNIWHSECAVAEINYPIQPPANTNWGLMRNKGEARTHVGMLPVHVRQFKSRDMPNVCQFKWRRRTWCLLAGYEASHCEVAQGCPS
jgi:hypothetical protein